MEATTKQIEMSNARACRLPEHAEAARRGAGTEFMGCAQVSAPAWPGTG